MKKIMTLMLGMSVLAGTATFVLAADDKDAPKKKAKTTMVCDDKSKPTKENKCKDGKDAHAPAAKKDKK